MIDKVLKLFKPALRSLMRNKAEREREFYRRHRELSDKLELMPDSLTHYVLRGELLAERGDVARARLDFEKAVELAENNRLEQGWDLLEQVMRDRALQGIDFVARYSV